MAWAARMTAALDQRALDKPPLWPAIICGGFSGLLAGITGIGGGLFVAATMLLLGWAPTKRVAASAQTSNLYTAASAFAAIWLKHPALPPALPVWSLAAACGGLLGVWLGSRYLPAKALRYMLSRFSAVRRASGHRLRRYFFLALLFFSAAPFAATDSIWLPTSAMRCTSTTSSMVMHTWCSPQGSMDVTLIVLAGKGLTKPTVSRRTKAGKP